MKFRNLALFCLPLIYSIPTRSEPCSGKVTYLSSSIDAYAYLENTQRELYDANPRLVHDAYLREQLNDPNSIVSWEDLIGKLVNQGIIDRSFANNMRNSIMCDKLPTKYESPLTYLLLKLNFDAVSSAKRKYYPNSQEVYFGTLPTGAIEAQALIPQGLKDPIVIVNRDVFHFTGKFSKAISAAIPIDIDRGQVALSYDEERIRQHVRENSWILEDFAQAMFLMVTRGSPAQAKERLLDADHNRLHARLVGGLDFFIIGHELGHVVLGHTGSRKLYALASNEFPDNPSKTERSVSLTLADYDGNQELAADGVSLKLFVRSTMEAGPDALLSAAIGAAGGDLFFALIDLADKYGSMLGRPPMHDIAHPPAAVRSRNLDEVYNSEELKSLGLHEMPDFRLLTRMAFRVLAEETEPTLTSAIEQHRQATR